MKFSKLICSTLAFIMLTIIMSCTKTSINTGTIEDGQLTGKWQSVAYQYKEFDKAGHCIINAIYKAPGFHVTMELNPDGTGIWKDTSSWNEDRNEIINTITWYQTSERRIKLMLPFDVETFYVISNTSKTLVLNGTATFDDIRIDCTLYFKK